MARSFPADLLLIWQDGGVGWGVWEGGGFGGVGGGFNKCMVVLAVNDVARSLSVAPVM